MTPRSLRDCAAAASNGEFSIANNGSANYIRYIDGLVAQIQSTCCLRPDHSKLTCGCPPEFPDVRVIAGIYIYTSNTFLISLSFSVIEPDSLANLVTNLNMPKCAGAQTAYKVCAFLPHTYRRRLMLRSLVSYTQFNNSRSSGTCSHISTLDTPDGSDGLPTWALPLSSSRRFTQAPGRRSSSVDWPPTLPTTTQYV
jgi:hypothetical protein